MMRTLTETVANAGDDDSDELRKGVIDNTHKCTQNDEVRLPTQSGQKKEIHWDPK